MIAAVASTKRAAAKERATSYDSIVRDVWAPIDASGGVTELVRAATLAANSHNTQPWRFEIANRRITIHADFSRRYPAVDPDDHHLFASLGCAAENIVQAAALMGFKAAVSPDPTINGALPILLEPIAAKPAPLIAVIPERQCTRAA